MVCNPEVIQEPFVLALPPPLLVEPPPEGALPPVDPPVVGAEPPPAVVEVPPPFPAGATLGGALVVSVGVLWRVAGGSTAAGMGVGTDGTGAAGLG
jgi:hypothetical protein